MTFWFTVILGFSFAYALWFAIGTVLYIFKLNIPPFVRSLLAPILWIVVIVFFLFAPEEVTTDVFLIGCILAVLCIFAHKIIEWIEKSKE